jgi:hypothetical protein
MSQYASLVRNRAPKRSMSNFWESCTGLVRWPVLQPGGSAMGVKWATQPFQGGPQSAEGLQRYIYCTQTGVAPRHLCGASNSMPQGAPCHPRILCPRGLRGRSMVTIHLC